MLGNGYVEPIKKLVTGIWCTNKMGHSCLAHENTALQLFRA